ncbi:MAG TPA: S8 family serine peptidase [Chitinophagaceae bacterium]|nr:S8 family serine peptidase [Chitinophagaceae bacterium]
MKPNPIPLTVATLLLSLLLSAQVPKDSSREDYRYKLLLKSGSFVPQKSIAAQINQFNHKAVQAQTKTFAVIQFEKIPTSEERKELQNSGIELLDYIPNNAYTVTITGPLNTTILIQLKTRAIVELTAEQKMQPELAKGNFPTWAIKVGGTIDVWASFPKSFSYETVNTELRNRNFDIVSSGYKDYRIITLRIPIQRLNELASLPFIEYVEAAPHEAQLLINKSTVNGRANVLRSLLPGGRNLRGDGVVIGVGDDSNPLRHIDMSGRIINRAAISAGSHGVLVEGIVGGAGNIAEKYTGFAPKATIIAQNSAGILAYAPAYVQDYNMVVTNNSYGNIVDDCSSFGTYTLYSRILDQMAIDLPNLETVFAAGNSGAVTCSSYPFHFGTVLGDYQSAKNLITVGTTTELSNIGFFSSRGPVKDGRIKPEICAQGESVASTYPVNTYATASGTSLSSPAVAGGLALLYQRYRQLHSNADPKNGLMKALLCNGATDLGNNGPDYTYGFGWMNLLRSVKMLEQNNYFNDSVANTANNIHTITVPANAAQLKVMLYWNDPAAAVLARQTLVNDLDLEVLDPSMVTILPMLLDTIPANANATAGTGADHVNNIEQVVINNPLAGTYKIKVKGTTVTQNPKQEYFLVYDTIPVSTTLTYPIGGEHLVQGDFIYISWDSWGNPGNTYKIEYSKDNGSSWTSINDNVAANLRQYKWFLPSTDTTELARIRITCNGTGIISTSEKFIIIGVPTITLSAIQCEGYFSINWTGISGATDYEVMTLQGDQMVSIATTTNTFYTISGLSKDSVYWVSVRARINGTPGLRGLAISRQPNNGNCTGTMSDNDLKLDTILSPASSGRKYTSTELSNSVPVIIRIKNLDDASTTGDITVSYIFNGGSPVTETITNPAISAGGTFPHTFSTTVNMSSAGSYQLKVSISHPGDVVTQNDSLTKTFKQLDNPAINLTTAFVDNIEAATSQSLTGNQIGLGGLDRYDFLSSTIYGRISTFVNTGVSYSGSKALTLDVDRFVASGNADSLTATFNLAAYDTATDDIRLDFRYKNHDQQNNAADKVWIRGNDQQNWIPVYDLYANQNEADGSYKLSSSIELGDSLAAHSQNFSSSFQVRWGQFGRIIAADDYGGDGYTFDDIRIYAAKNDIRLVSIDTPIVSSCNLSAITPVTITVRNNANAAISNIPVVMKIDGVVVANETIPAITANTSIQYTFSQKANLAANGNHTILVWVDLTIDSYHDNDSSKIILVNSPVITSFPYIENFETNDGYWYSGGSNNSWEYGTPASAKINRAASGSKAWKTRLAGNYNDLEKSYLYSPCFDISGMSVPTLSFSIALDLEDCGTDLCDGTYIEYSSDGKTWVRLGTYNQTGSTNWYNKNYTGSNIWSVQDYTRWHVATIPLPTGLNQLRLRFVIITDPAVNKEGIAIDDIHIYNNLNGIYDGATMGSPITQNINGGTNWINYTTGGKLVASVQPRNQDMGNTDVQAFINNGPVRNYNGQYYLDRSITIKPAKKSLADSAIIRFYFLDREADSLVLGAKGCPSCSKSSSIYETGISKYNDSLNQFENGLLSDDTLGSWNFIPASIASRVPFLNGYYVEFKTNSFSEFWINNGGPGKVHALRVELSAFNAKKISNNDVIVNWTTVAENNVFRYEIELARNNADYQNYRFVKIGEINSPGNSITAKQYSFIDVEANKTGVRYYRLKIIYADGGFTYSSVKSVIFQDGITILVYPNPSSGIFNLVYQLEEGQAIILQIYNTEGKLIRKQAAIASGFMEKIVLDLNQSIYPKGLYLFKLNAGNKQQSFKLIKQ